MRKSTGVTQRVHQRSKRYSHAAYAVQRLLRFDAVDGRTALGRRRRRLRLEYGVASGYPDFAAMPAPARAAIDNAIRAQLLCERLFSPFWSGGEVPYRYSTIAEHLRRQLSDVGLEPHGAPLDVAAALAAMRKSEGKA